MLNYVVLNLNGLFGFFGIIQFALLVLSSSAIWFRLVIVRFDAVEICTAAVIRTTTHTKNARDLNTSYCF